MPDRSNLRRFLVDARARLTPSAAGIASTGRRRVLGLRRDEVAQLAGMSDVWYTRFETGRAQLSTKAVLRVAGALQLGASETAHLLRLAGSDAGPAPLLDELGGGTGEMRAVRRAFSVIHDVTSIDDLRLTIVRAVIEVAHTPALVFWLDEREPECGFWFEAAEGRGAADFLGHYEGPAVMKHIPRRRLLDGPISENLAESPSAEHRVNALRLGAGSYRTVPVQSDGTDRSIRIGWASRDVGEFPGLQREALGIIGDLTRWALTTMPLGGSS